MDVGFWSSRRSRGAAACHRESFLTPEQAGERPDLLIESSQPLGNGSAAVCDLGPPPPEGEGGGIPAIDPPDFGPGDSITAALLDFACRFAVQPTAGEACTLNSFGDYAFRSPDSTIQYCNQFAAVSAFPVGLTVLTARLRDVAGNLGPPAQIVIDNPGDS